MVVVELTIRELVAVAVHFLAAAEVVVVNARGLSWDKVVKVIKAVTGKRW